MGMECECVCAYVLVDGDTLCAHVCVHVCEGLVSLSINQSVSTGVLVSDVWRKGSVPKINNSREA